MRNRRGILYFVIAPGVPHRLGSSGGSHGGLGGRGGCGVGYLSCRLKRNLPYGSLYNPVAYGSGGGGSLGGIGTELRTTLL